MAINRDGLKAQIEGGILFGFSAALYRRLSFANSILEQKNFNNFNALHMNGTPEINTFIIDSHEDAGGIGEVGTTAAFPSLGNALFSATGQRQRFYTFSPHPAA
ncbi:membrane-bound aldehyde dehydrogenase, large subunit [Gluconobacter oxydans H24]|nr:membrane-bound aldehyde dehydrogenase, large subunit [Gluconobacter oxydans H24]